jgi:hypothetical protein
MVNLNGNGASPLSTEIQTNKERKKERKKDA